ncbi:MAG TPA: hypothetical protein VGJ33_00540 [Candidatus Angelobacter sp.]|jgi:hypothetical protein
MAKKKKGTPKNSKSGIYDIYVDNNYVGRKLPGLTEAAAIERWKRENPADAAKNVKGRKIKDMPLFVDSDQYARQLEQIEQQEKQVTQAHIDSFLKK